MKKRTLTVIIITSAMLVMIRIGGTYYMNGQSDKVKALYPRSAESFVGDPMPYFDGKSFLIYYLEDLRDGQIGFHPFSLLKTQDFYHYENVGEVIPYVNEPDSQERALGTGSVMKDEVGLYHAFYTAHNGDLEPKEAIMHATSKDGKSWQKIPEDTFFASDRYEANDFRDPYVLYVESYNEYWMLITTRQEGKGVIAKYRSTDLNQWEDAGVFFENDLGNDSNLECPSLVYFEDQWYLAFSDQWDQRIVHYRVAQSLDQPFELPKESIDHVDGAGFYAGRLETDGEQLYLVGWIPTKEQHDDRFAYNWAGNLAVHQLTPTVDGLIAQVPATAKKNIEKVTLSQAQIEGESIDGQEEAAIYTANLVGSDSAQVALSFAPDHQLVIDFGKQTLSYHKSTLKKLEASEATTVIPIVIEGDHITVEIVKEQDIIVVYVGGRALSNRIYKAKEADWFIEILQGQVSLSEESSSS